MQSAIAATPAAAWKGYLLGGILWFAVPFTLATSLGIAAVALDLPLSTDEANMGLVALASASVSTSPWTSAADLHAMATLEDYAWHLIGQNSLIVRFCGATVIKCLSKQ